MKRPYLLNALAVSLLRAQEVSQPVTLAGEVENPPQRFLVVAVDGRTHIPVRQSFGSTDGRFQIGPLNSGPYELRVTTERGEVLATEQVDVNSGSAPLTVRLRQDTSERRPISGVVRAADLRPERRAAIKLLRAGRLEEAVQRDPTFAVAHHELAIAYTRQNRPWDGRTELLKAIELDPNLEVAYTDLAVVDLKLGNPEGAEQCALKALGLDKADTRAQAALDVARKLSKRWPESRR